MLTKKQEQFFNIILNYYNLNKELPTIGILKKISNYKSYNTIYKYLDQLEKKEFIKFNKKLKKLTYLKSSFYDNLTLTIPIVNTLTYLQIYNNLPANKSYLAYKVEDNSLKNYLIKKDDILIIEKNSSFYNNHLVLVEVANKYQIFKYVKKDSFVYLYNDKNNFTLANTKIIIGKVISLIRDIN